MSSKQTAKGSAGKKIVVRQVRGMSGHDQRTRRALCALGLGRIGKSREFQVNPALAGIIRQVSHLVTVDEAK